jgi:cytochrome c-type biogenesis protein CcmH
MLDSSAAGRVTGKEMVYISIKGPGGGPPLAAFKHQGASFPVEFQLTTADKIPMAGDRPIPDKVQLSIRVDADGNAFTKEEGAPSAVIEGVAKGSTDLTVTLK